MQRHLIYHCYPVAGNGMWQWNIEQLRQRLPLFTGRRTVAIVVDRDTDEPAAVQNLLGASEADWIIKANDPNLGECATWHDLWGSVAGLPGATFRGHARGVSPHDKFILTSASTTRVWQRFGVISNTDIAERAERNRLWTAAIYISCLDDWSLVEDLLTRHPIAGPFKEVLPNRSPPWMYLGSCFWVRNADLRNWQGVQMGYYGSESWPGEHYSIGEAGCIVCESYGVVMPTKDTEFFRHVLVSLRGQSSKPAPAGT
jgi:hypothetical protein